MPFSLCSFLEIAGQFWLKFSRKELSLGQAIKLEGLSLNGSSLANLKQLRIQYYSRTQMSNLNDGSCMQSHL